jgi:hypothetical protein
VRSSIWTAPSSRGRPDGIDTVTASVGSAQCPLRSRPADAAMTPVVTEPRQFAPALAARMPVVIDPESGRPARSADPKRNPPTPEGLTAPAEGRRRSRRPRPRANRAGWPAGGRGCQWRSKKWATKNVVERRVKFKKRFGDTSYEHRWQRDHSPVHEQAVPAYTDSLIVRALETRLSVSASRFSLNALTRLAWRSCSNRISSKRASILARRFATGCTTAAATGGTTAATSGGTTAATKGRVLRRGFVLVLGIPANVIANGSSRCPVLHTLSTARP